MSYLIRLKDGGYEYNLNGFPLPKCPKCSSLMSPTGNVELVVPPQVECRCICGHSMEVPDTRHQSPGRPNHFSDALMKLALVIEKTRLAAYQHPPRAERRRAVKANRKSTDTQAVASKMLDVAMQNVVGKGIGRGQQ